MEKIIKRVAHLQHAMGSDEQHNNVYLYSTGQAHAHNGIVGITIPFPSSFDAAVSGRKFIQAISACKALPTFKLTDSNLIIKDGKTRIQVPLVAKDAPELELHEFTNIYSESDSRLIKTALDSVIEFTPSGKSLSEYNYVVVSDYQAYATDGGTLANSVIPLDDMVIPAALVKIVNRIDYIEGFEADGNAIYVKSDDDCYFKMAAPAVQLPDLKNVFEIQSAKVEAMEKKLITPEFREALTTIDNITSDNNIIFVDNIMQSQSGDVIINDINMFNNAYKYGLPLARFKQAIAGTTTFTIGQDKNIPALFSNEYGQLQIIMMPVVNI